MFRRIFARSNWTAVAVLGSLLVPQFAAAQQGQHLYEWSGGGRSSSGPSYSGGYGNFATPAPSYYTVPGPLPSGDPRTLVLGITGLGVTLESRTDFQSVPLGKGTD